MNNLGHDVSRAAVQARATSGEYPFQLAVRVRRLDPAKPLALAAVAGAGRQAQKRGTYPGVSRG